MYNKADPKAIHETIIRDLVDVALDIKNTDELQFFFGKGNSFKSVASASSSLTLVFPNVIPVDAMDIETAIMISKAQERKCVAMLQMLFSAFQVSDAENAIEYISKFHTNLKLDGDITVDKFIGAMDSIASKLEAAGAITVDHEKYEAVKEDMKDAGYYLPETINETPLNNYRYSRLRGGCVVQEAVPALKNVSKNKKILDDPHSQVKNAAEFYNKSILASDIKKANELVPTMMIINIISKSGDSSSAVQTAVVGVKSKMYPATSADIIDRIRSKNRDGNGLNTFIRATTKEISFWKDFIFALNKAKLDALSSSKRSGTSPIWKLLERRALKSRLRRTFRFTNDATAITTLTITKDMAETLKKTDNINIEDERTARGIMESLNLMGITIANEALEAADFIYDTGDDLYETVTFSSLERESSDNTYKKVVNLMSKMR